MFYWIANILIHSEPLVYHNLLACWAQSTFKMYLFLKADTTVPIFMIILYVYLVSLTLFLCIYFTCICIHMHYPRYHVLYTIVFKIIILTAQYICISQQSSILHISYNYHPEIHLYIWKALGLIVHRLLFFCCNPINLTNVIYSIISYILNDIGHISGLFCVIFKTFCLIVIN